jgi:hypothetical protein
MILRWLISAIGFAALKGEASTLARNVGRRAAVVVLLALVWVTAIGFALGSLTVWLSHEFGMVAACAIIAAGLAVIGLGVQLAVMLRARRKPSGRLTRSVRMGAARLLRAAQTSAQWRSSPELTAAFLCAHLGIQGELRHAGYIADWISLLKEDDRAIFTAASKASQAADFL